MRAYEQSEVMGGVDAEYSSSRDLYLIVQLVVRSRQTKPYKQYNHWPSQLRLTFRVIHST